MLAVRILHNCIDWDRFNSCERKIRYGHRATADKANDAMSRKTGTAFESYRCAYCGGWHIGHAR